MKTTPRIVALVAATMTTVSVTAKSPFHLSGPMSSSTFGVPKQTNILSPIEQQIRAIQRGGASAAATSVEEEIEIESSDEEVDESESEEEEDEEEVAEDEEENVTLDPKLTKATQLKATNIKTKMAKESLKAAVATTKTTKIETKKTAKKSSSSSSLLKLFYIPYIIKACLNPFTFMKMTKAYWSSLVNLNYLASQKADSSQDLRSALEQKAKKSGGNNSSSSRGKRKFKPGQAKASGLLC